MNAINIQFIVDFLRFLLHLFNSISLTGIESFNSAKWMWIDLNSALDDTQINNAAFSIFHRDTEMLSESVFAIHFTLFAIFSLFFSLAMPFHCVARVRTQDSRDRIQIEEKKLYAGMKSKKVWKKKLLSYSDVARRWLCFSARHFIKHKFNL